MPKKKAATKKVATPRLPGNRTTRGQRNPKVAEPYVPSQLHLEWYKLWAEGHLRVTLIAERYKVSRQSVHGAVRRVADYMRLETFDEIIDIRHRQTAALESLVNLARTSFDESRGEHTVKTVRKVTGDKSTETTTRTEHLAGNPAYLNVARDALADIRKIWGVDKPIVKEEVEMDAEGLERVAGVPRAQAIRIQGELLLRNAAEMEQSRDASKPT